MEWGKALGAILRLVLCGFLVGLVSCQAVAQPLGNRVTVKQIISGNTIEVISTNEPTATPQRVRLIGIDAPDLKQLPWGVDAKNQLEQLIGGQPVLLEFDREPVDAYQRQLAYVWRDGKLLNEQLVKAGYAMAVARSPNTKYDRRLAQAQEWARVMGLGIWNPAQPMRLTPAEFRRQNQ